MENSTDKAPRSVAMRSNKGKVQWSLVDFDSLEDMVRVLEFGAKKYDLDNWKKGLPMKQQCESVARHLFALMKGEVNDPETGLPHWAHIQCNAMFMAHTMKHHQEHDNLPHSSSVENERIGSGMGTRDPESDMVHDG